MKIETSVLGKKLSKRFHKLPRGFAILQMEELISLRDDLDSFIDRCKRGMTQKEYDYYLTCNEIAKLDEKG